MKEQNWDSILPVAVASLKQEAQEIAQDPGMVRGLLRQCADADGDVRYDAYQMLVLLPDTTSGYAEVRAGLVAAFSRETDEECRFLLAGRVSEFAEAGEPSAIRALEEGARSGDRAIGCWCESVLARIQAFEGQVRQELEAREPGHGWRALPMRALERALERSRVQRGQRFEITRFDGDAEGLTCGLECVSGTPYVFYETTDASAWGRFLLCSVWGKEPIADAESDGHRLVRLTRGDENDDGIHWIRLAMMDAQERAEPERTTYGCKVALPLIGKAEGAALLMLSEPVALEEVDYLTNFPTGNTWSLPLVGAMRDLQSVKSPGQPDSEPFEPVQELLFTDEKRYVQVVLLPLPDGQLEWEARCLSPQAVGHVVVIHVAFSNQGTTLWHTSHIFQNADETIRRTLTVPGDVPLTSLTVSISVPVEENR